MKMNGTTLSLMFLTVVLGSAIYLDHKIKGGQNPSPEACGALAEKHNAADSSNTYTAGMGSMGRCTLTVEAKTDPAP